MGVILDTMRQIETFLLQRHYDGFLKKGRIRARSANTQAGAIGDALDLKAVGKLCLAVGSHLPLRDRDLGVAPLVWKMTSDWTLQGSEWARYLTPFPI